MHLDFQVWQDDTEATINSLASNSAKVHVHTYLFQLTQLHIFEGLRVTGGVSPASTTVGFAARGKLRVPQGARQWDRWGQGQCQGDAGGVQSLHGGAEDPDFRSF